MSLTAARIIAISAMLLGGSAAGVRAQGGQVLASAQERLWDGAVAGDTAMIRKAVTDGAKLDSLDTRRSVNGRYALNWAAWGNRADALRLLIELKAPLEAENRTGFTALAHAAEAGAIEAAKILLNAGADPDHATHDGVTPATIASMKEHEDLARILENAPRKKR